MKTSKKDLQASYEACDTELRFTSFALQAALDGEVKWIRNEYGAVGIVRADSASGGAVIVRAKEDKFPRVYGLETWHARTIAKVNQLLGIGSLSPADADKLDAERELAREVLAMRDVLAGYTVVAEVR